MFDWLNDALGGLEQGLSNAGLSGTVQVGDSQTGAQLTFGNRPRFGLGTLLVVGLVVYLVATRK